MVTGITINGRTVLGSFGKGTEGSIALNFATSGGSNCDTDCRYHPRSTNPDAASEVARCYAAACENRHDRQALLAKLQRHEATDAADIIDAASAEMDRKSWKTPWFRFSAFGSVPSSVPSNFRKFIERLVSAGIPIHFPVETLRKAETYRMALAGIRVAVRESITCASEWTRNTSGPVSIVAGSMKDSPRKRVTLAKEMAERRSLATGRRVIVCPSVAAMHLRVKHTSAKCGNCTACANPDVDIVYPVHK